MSYAADVAPAHLRLLGAAEVLGALGLVFPWLLRRAPVLTPAALAVAAGRSGLAG